MALTKNNIINALKLLLKLVVSGAAIAFVSTMIDLNTTWSLICSAKWPLLLVALIIYAMSQVLSAFRTNSLFATMPLDLPALTNIRLYWLGMFYNFFLPGGVGGDGYKVYYIHRHYNQPVKSLVTILLSDRLSGLVVICCYLCIFATFFVTRLPIPGREWLVLLIIPGLAAYYLFLYIFKRTSTKAFWKVISYSFLVQGLQMATACLILKALGGEDNFDSYMFLFFVSSIASAIPVSIAGIGLRETAFVIGSQYLSTNGDMAVSLSIIFYATSLVSAIPGAYYAFKPSAISK